MNRIKRYLGVLSGCAILLLALSAYAIAQPAQQNAPQPPAQASMGMRGSSMMGSGMGMGMGRGPMHMGSMGGMGDACGMGDMGMMQMMKSDPKTMARMMELRGQMMQLHGEMMRMMGDAMIQRGKELQKGK